MRTKRPDGKIRNGDKAILRRGNERIPIKVMVRAEGYAMVRRRGDRPFVCDEKDLLVP